MESMGRTSPDASWDAPGSRPLSFSRRRRDGGAAREAPALPSGQTGSGQGVNEKGADHAREERVIGPGGEREGGARSDI